METKEIIHNQIYYRFRHSVFWLQKQWDRILVLFLSLCMITGGIWYCLRYTEPEEDALRRKIVTTAEKWLGCRESDGSHRQIIDLYNGQETLPRDYTVTYEDNWCATFGSAAAIAAGLDALIPPECSCEQQIQLFAQQDDWVEDDRYLPKPGDYIYYVWDEWRSGDCTAWANHVGIVAKTFGPVIKVIEGNKDDAVDYRYIFLNDLCIRGYGTPDYRGHVPKTK